MRGLVHGSAGGRRSKVVSGLAGVLAVLVVLAALAAPAVVAAGSVTVRITDRLEPATITVAPGTTVVWRNDSGNRHRMRSVDHSGDRDWDTGDIEPGERASVTFTTPGTFPYIDERDDDNRAFHGSVVVRATGGGDAPAGPTAPPEGGAVGTPQPSPPGGGGAPQPVPPGGGGDAPAAGTATVSMAGRAFSPSSVRIAAGGTVSFRNNDDDAHTATATDAAWDSGVLAAGSSFDRRFPAAGTFAFLCLIHPDMRGTVRVTAGSGGAAPAPADPAPADPTPPATPTPTTDAALPSPTTDPALPSPSVPPSRVVAAPPGTVDVAVVDLAFEPATVEVVRGATVRWTNRGQALHTATAEDGAFDSGFLAAGATFEEAFDTPGTFSYVCQLHPGMTGSIVVAVGAGPPSAPPTGAAGDPPAAASSAPPAAASPAQPSPASPVAAAGPPVGSPAPAGPGDTSTPDSAAAERLAPAAPARSSMDLPRIAVVLLLVGAAVTLFGRIVRATVRPR